MAGKQLTRTVVVQAPPGSGQSFKVLEPGDEVPDWAADQLGDHCFEPVEDVAAPIATSVTEDEAAADGDGETPTAAKKSAAKKS